MKIFVFGSNRLTVGKTGIVASVFAAIILTFTGLRIEPALGIVFSQETARTPDDSSDADAEVDFFAPDDASGSDSSENGKEALTPPASDDSKENKSSATKKTGFLSGLFLGKNESDEEKSDYRTPLESVLPIDSLMTARTVPIRQLNEKLRSLLTGVGFGDLSPWDWLRFSPYGKALRHVDPSRPLGLCWINVEGEAEPGVVLFVPIRRYRPFVEALGADAASYQTDDAIPVGTLFHLTRPSDWVSFQKKGYALLLKKKDASSAERILKARPVGTELFYPAGLKDSDIRLEVTSFGIRRFLDLNRAAESDIRTLLPIIFRSLGRSGEELDLPSREITFRFDRFSQWVRRNLSELVLEGKITDGTVLTSLVFLPAPGSELAFQVDNQGGPVTPTLLDQPGFLKVLPAAPSPLSGQTDLFPEFAAKLDAPFNRVRHIEYSFGLPQDGELLAESWAFFLEVDDAEAFVRELIIPKAQLIGSHIGSEKAGQVAGELLGNLSLRRRMAGRRPLFFESPEEAAAAGQSFGSRLGGEIGSSVGEKEGMKTRDFEGYPLYVSDLVLYAQQMKEIRSRRSGETSPPPIFLTGEPTMRLMIANILTGLQSGTLEGMIRDRFVNLSGDGVQDGTPLLARQNLILILDQNHILIVPGNGEILRAAKDQWRDFLDRNGAGISETAVDDAADWRFARDLIYREMTDETPQILRSAARFDLAGSQYLADYIRRHYAPDFPRTIREPVPFELPAPLFISTNARNAGYLYASFSNDFLKLILHAKLDQMKAKQAEKP